MRKVYVNFKSDTPNYYPERDGTKRNTVRKIDLNDVRFKVNVTHIGIIHAQNQDEIFIREITNITDYDGYRIYSW